MKKKMKRDLTDAEKAQIANDQVLMLRTLREIGIKEEYWENSIKRNLMIHGMNANDAEEWWTVICKTEGGGKSGK